MNTFQIIDKKKVGLLPLNKLRNQKQNPYLRKNDAKINKIFRNKIFYYYKKIIQN